MKPKQKSNKVPLNAYTFYIRLYCERKGSTKSKLHSNLVEATNSWLSLNESEKQLFYTKYKECKEQYRAKFLNKLKNAEPFMKKKEISSKCDNSTNISFNKTEPEGDAKEENEVVESEHMRETTEQFILDTDSSIPLLHEDTHQDIQDDQTENEIEPVNDNNKSPHRTLIEPLPPSIKTGHELFSMLNSADETNNMTWESLPQIEKSQYSRAVSIMKKDYISKYREYLESLSSEELFHHYNKTI